MIVKSYGPDSTILGAYVLTLVILVMLEILELRILRPRKSVVKIVLVKKVWTQIFLSHGMEHLGVVMSVSRPVSGNDISIEKV